MADENFRDPRWAALYDPLDPDRRDLDAYLAMAEEFGARSVLDIGCGTGVLALLLAARGLDVVGVDPATASIAVARAKSSSEAVRWVVGDATALPPLQVDLATLTGNAAQAIVDPPTWHATLRAAFAALRPGGHLVLETRDPARRAWQEWTRSASYAETDVPAAGGRVAHWVELISVHLPLVTFRGTAVLPDGETLTSTSTLRFRDRDELSHDLTTHGFTLTPVRDAPDRPGREFVFVARRP
ncbi:class I SAM-dependent methyltransferase [Streptomyces sp. NPDC060194]|uniref:class I SAM-dependent methyltransferase n=1 Tax=Streptomyces sp. NPDC060194 TaxID=3347069 RepID=UPI003654E08B